MLNGLPRSVTSFLMLIRLKHNPENDSDDGAIEWDILEFFDILIDIVLLHQKKMCQNRTPDSRRAIVPIKYNLPYVLLTQ